MITGSGVAERPLLLLVATGMRSYREYLLGPISTEFRVHLFHTVEPTWEREYLSGWTVLPDTYDGPALAAAATELHQVEPFDGVLCWDEGRIHAASHIAEALKLPNGDPAVIWRLRDKGQTRQALAAAGVPQPLSIPVSTEEEALAAAERIGYPVIVKPRGYGASIGVIKVASREELARGFSFTRTTTLPDPVVFNSAEPYLVEECVTGEEISVDSVVHHGVVTALFVGRKQVGYPPYAEEVGHFVEAADPLLADPEFARLLTETHAALGFTDGWTHSEFMLTADGPRLIEVNGRLGGDLIPYLGRLATGIDPGLAAARVACGQAPELTATLARTTGVRFFYVAEEDTVIGSVDFDRQRLPAAIDRAVAVAAPGAVVSPPPRGTVWGRIAYATAAADDRAACGAALDAAEAALVVLPG
ncbi:ATP-grasp domain-containing protein [Kitasatospora sp. NBC_01287]|uniref:ATP-grasp domain-containing protein n=1 Tax=Kitasatospora sp. NBC_01287 TaxID=2903573 RepID=UPI002251C03E|nr:ATP-grasp domain-containing protein [Kitasatospora sp. NBC_01287]MCX4749976.1 ATP-grasp domain-containing protein [Kitasatospora sp. NBC_01287]